MKKNRFFGKVSKLAFGLTLMMVVGGIPLTQSKKVDAASKNRVNACHAYSMYDLKDEKIRKKLKDYLDAKHYKHDFSKKYFVIKSGKTVVHKYDLNETIKIKGVDGNAYRYYFYFQTQTTFTDRKKGNGGSTNAPSNFNPNHWRTTGFTLTESPIKAVKNSKLNYSGYDAHQFSEKSRAYVKRIQPGPGQTFDGLCSMQGKRYGGGIYRSCMYIVDIKPYFEKFKIGTLTEKTYIYSHPLMNNMSSSAFINPLYYKMIPTSDEHAISSHFTHGATELSHWAQMYNVKLCIKPIIRKKIKVHPVRIMATDEHPKIGDVSKFGRLQVYSRKITAKGKTVDVDYFKMYDDGLINLDGVANYYDANKQIKYKLSGVRVVDDSTPKSEAALGKAINTQKLKSFSKKWYTKEKTVLHSASGKAHGSKADTFVGKNATTKVHNFNWTQKKQGNKYKTKFEMTTTKYKDGKSFRNKGVKGACSYKQWVKYLTEKLKISLIPKSKKGKVKGVYLYLIYKPIQRDGFSVVNRYWNWDDKNKEYVEDEKCREKHKDVCLRYDDSSLKLGETKLYYNSDSELSVYPEMQTKLPSSAKVNSNLCDLKYNLGRITAKYKLKGSKKNVKTSSYAVEVLSTEQLQQCDGSDESQNMLTLMNDIARGKTVNTNKSRTVIKTLKKACKNSEKFSDKDFVKQIGTSLHATLNIKRNSGGTIYVDYYQPKVPTTVLSYYKWSGPDGKQHYSLIKQDETRTDFPSKAGIKIKDIPNVQKDFDANVLKADGLTYETRKVTADCKLIKEESFVKHGTFYDGKTHYYGGKDVDLKTCKESLPGKKTSDNKANLTQSGDSWTAKVDNQAKGTYLVLIYSDSPSVTLKVNVHKAKANLSGVPKGPHYQENSAFSFSPAEELKTVTLCTGFGSAQSDYLAVRNSETSITFNYNLSELTGLKGDGKYGLIPSKTNFAEESGAVSSTITSESRLPANGKVAAKGAGITVKYKATANSDNVVTVDVYYAEVDNSTFMQTPTPPPTHTLPPGQTSPPDPNTSTSTTKIKWDDTPEGGENSSEWQENGNKGPLKLGEDAECKISGQISIDSLAQLSNEGKEANTSSSKADAPGENQTVTVEEDENAEIDETVPDAGDPATDEGSQDGDLEEGEDNGPGLDEEEEADLRDAVDEVVPDADANEEDEDDGTLAEDSGDKEPENTAVDVLGNPTTEDTDTEDEDDEEEESPDAAEDEVTNEAGVTEQEEEKLDDLTIPVSELCDNLTLPNGCMDWSKTAPYVCNKLKTKTCSSAYLSRGEYDKTVTNKSCTLDMNRDVTVNYYKWESRPGKPGWSGWVFDHSEIAHQHVSSNLTADGANYKFNYAEATKPDRGKTFNGFKVPGT